MAERSDLTPWKYGLSIAGDSLKYFIVTDGGNGAILYSGNDSKHVAAMTSNVVDTTGAGDAYASGLIHGMTTGLSIIDAMKEGAQWAAFAVATQSSIPGEALKAYLE